MSLKTLQIVKNKLLHEKMLAESNIEHLLMDNNLAPEEKSNQIIMELDKLKDSSLKINFWDEFVNNNIIIPGEENNKKENNN
jgi:hypothetical protein